MKFWAKLLSVALPASLAVMEARAQSLLYITDGDHTTLQGIDTTTGSIVFTNSLTAYWSYPIAVRDTIRLGYRENPGITGEFDLGTGALIGTLTTAPVGSPNWTEALDGAASADANFTFAWNGTSGTVVYKTDTYWSNAAYLFTVPASVMGAAYDSSSGHLWFVNSATIYEYTTSGTQISQFANSASNGNNGALAYQASTDSLWFVPNNTSAPLLQYSKTGTLLQSLTVNGRAANIWGAEFQAIPEPSTYALLALGLGLVVWLRRRR